MKSALVAIGLALCLIGWYLTYRGLYELKGSPQSWTAPRLIPTPLFGSSSGKAQGQGASSKAAA